MLIEQKIIFHAQELILNKDVSEKVKFETPIQVGIIICVLLRRAVDEGSIKGVSICRRSPAVLYLFFTDECLLFVKGDLSAAETLKSLLAYERVSGQKINFQKSALYCNLTMNENLKASNLIICKFLWRRILLNIWSFLCSSAGIKDKFLAQFRTGCGKE